MRGRKPRVPHGQHLRVVGKGESGGGGGRRDRRLEPPKWLRDANARREFRRLADLLNEHFALLNEAIEAEGGTIDKYIGDSVMAFWGAPEDQPDHAARACRAALQIAQALGDDNRRRQADGKAPIRLRIGIHSGTAVVGNIGAPGRVNYTLVGDTVNIAQRLEGLAKDVGVAPDADAVILVSEETQAELPSDFALDAEGQHELRGHSGTVAVYRLVTEAR